MSKSLKQGRRMAKKILPKVDHSSPLQVYIPAGMASAKPPLGSQLGQRNINIANFCKEFNNKTAHIKEGVPLPCRIKARADGGYDLVIHHPPTSYFLKQAAGIERGKIMKGEIAGKITLKHLYEIACVKAQDPPMALLNVQQICQMLVGIARTCGIEIVRTLDPKEHEEFMKQREANVEQRREDLRLAKEAKLLRGSA
ncbi:mitochondrial ribosomal protein L11 [Megachile rotundata]|uniref:mitochondrial ribosomal protein L11 n=1 Tax=Megachile rotundata TaxID=143995 RepID=UPI000258F2C6|nr:PREDICTED: 39S ribosomal protein L11, mitochondrial [Megachile rotundata]XP_012150075.1 PREDICTED: 39S ribosomal protein L11, mitochondrial [Megachile rotundata]